tara:strand:+ start:2158 stop:3048 length:891 start_codon:yes stop_codon:yes gene_type:complete
MANVNNYSIDLNQPYNLKETLYSGQAFRWESINIKDSNKVWHQGIVNNRRIRIHQSKNKIHLWTSESYTKSQINDVISYLRLNDDMKKIYSEISNDKYISSAIETYSGLHLLNQNPWETLITFICSSNNNIPRIRQLVNAMSVNFGQKVEDDFGTFHLFPSSTELHFAGEQSLRAIGLGFRAKYVAAAAKLDVSNTININDLIDKNYQESLEQLTNIPGVGDKVANCILLFSLNKLEAFPVDVWIKRVLREIYIDDTLAIPDTKIRNWAQEKFGQYSGYANQYLFHNRRLFDKSIK